MNKKQEILNLIEEYAELTRHEKQFTYDCYYFVKEYSNNLELFKNYLGYYKNYDEKVTEGNFDDIIKALKEIILKEEARQKPNNPKWMKIE